MARGVRCVTFNQLLRIQTSPLVRFLPLGGGVLGLAGAVVLTVIGGACLAWLLRDKTTDLGGAPGAAPESLPSSLDDRRGDLPREPAE